MTLFLHDTLVNAILNNSVLKNGEFNLADLTAVQVLWLAEADSPFICSLKAIEFCEDGSKTHTVNIQKTSLTNF